MSPESQRTKIAEACPSVFHINRFSSGEVQITWSEYKDVHGPAPSIDILSDLNAMHEVEKAMTDDQQEHYVCVLDRMLHGGRASDLQECFVSLHATAAQRAEALLKTLGLWEDGE